MEFTQKHILEYSEFLESSEEMIESVTLLNEENNSRPKDDMEGRFNPKADMTFTVKDKNILLHMRDNCFFASAMFDVSSY